MAYVAKRSGRSSGVYRYLTEVEELEFGRWQEGERRRLRNGYPPERYPRQRRLDAVRAGLPVTVFRSDLTASRYRELRQNSRFDLGADSSGWGRIIVSPDDLVTRSDENCTRAWLEEEGL